jgi:hypothetical protein
MKQMLLIPDFTIEEVGIISKNLKTSGIRSFHQLAEQVWQLPYGRNADKYHPETIFTDQCGTCSTKHALLQMVMDEHGRKETRLILGIFRMNGKNTPKIQQVLEQYQLNYIPEAHNFLRTKDGIADFTGHGFDPLNYEQDMMHEIQLEPMQIVDFKIAYHKDFIADWIRTNPQGNYSASDLWKIREACIQALSEE